MPRYRPAGAFALMRTESVDAVSRYPSSPSAASGEMRRMTDPRAAGPVETGIAYPVDGRTIAASSSAVRVAPAFPASTTIRVESVMLNGAPLRSSLKLERELHEGSLKLAVGWPVVPRLDLKARMQRTIRCK